MTSATIARDIPIVDVHDLTSEDPARLGRASDALREAFGVFGLVYIRNHAVDTAKLNSLYENFKAFTAKPDSEKRAYARGDLWYQRGWTPPNTEVAVAAGGQPDFKECYFAAPIEVDEEARAEYPQLYPENIWPEKNDAFRADYLALGNALHETGLLLLVGCARALKLPDDTFAKMLRGGSHVTRLLYYLPLAQNQVNTNILWGEEHTDFNLLTLLPGGRFYDPAGLPSARPDDQSGLYLRTRATHDAPNGHKVRGTAPEGCIVAQVGQQLEILTGGAFLATPHEITPPGVPGYSRMSSAHFMHMHANERLFPLAPFRTPASVKNYSPPVLAGTYAIKTLVDIGLAPKSAIDTLGYRHYDRLDSMRASET